MSERRFTLEQYQAYENLPQWALDNEDWESEDEYHSYWSTTIRNWAKAYRDEFQPLVDEWQKAIEYVEQMPTRASFDIFVPEVAIAQERIPFAICAVRQQTSMLFSNYPQPKFVAPSQNYDQYAAALNQMLVMELKANSFNALSFDLGVDVAYAGWGVLKTYVDPDQEGPFGKEGKIVIQKMDPAKVYVDPKAKRLKWDDLGYVIVDDDFDLGTARKMFPGGAHKISDDMRSTSQVPKNDGMFGHNLMSPVPNPIEGNATLRNTVNIMECWFKDDRLKFVANEVAVTNHQFDEVDDEFGGSTMIDNPDYDPEKPDVYMAPEVDEDGYVVGNWVPAYPDGRCIIVAAGKKVIEDFANPYWHKQAPFVFFRGAPSRRLFGVGDLTNIVKIDKKLNDILNRVHIMCQQEIERPMLADNRAFRPPRTIYKLSGQASAVLIIQQGSQFARMQPTEIPQFPWVYLARLDQALDMVMCVSGVQRGQLSEGSQLSAEAVSNLQGMAASMLKMKTELVAEGMKDLGYQMQWLQRQTYDEGIQINVSTPDGQQVTVEWNEKEAVSNYILDIEPGTGLPGADQAQANQGMQLWRENLVDRGTALQMQRVPNWQNIVQTLKNEELEKIQADAAGRAQGLYIKDITKQHTKKDGAGRKEK